MSVATELLATFDSEYAAHFADLTTLARALGAGHASEDVAQEALIYARGHLGQLRDPAKTRAWLRRMVVRGVQRWRRHNRASALDAADALGSGDFATVGCGSVGSGMTTPASG